MKETIREKVAEGNGICKIGGRKYQETTKVKQAIVLDCG